jgi:hypothetical protein
MKKIIAAFSLALFSFFHSPLSSLPSDGGYQVSVDEEAGIIDLENQAPHSVEMTEMPTAVIIVVDNAWVEANKELFSRATHLNVDDECAIAMEKFRKLKPEDGCLIVAQVAVGEEPQYFWYSGESIKEWLRDHSVDPLTRFPVHLVKYFNLNSLEVGSELGFINEEMMPRSRQALYSPEEILNRLSLIRQGASTLEQRLNSIQQSANSLQQSLNSPRQRDFRNCIVQTFRIIGVTIWGIILVSLGAAFVLSCLFVFGCALSLTIQAPDKMYRFCVAEFEPYV